jgi:hypothetical protein
MAADILPFIRVMDELLKDLPAARLTPQQTSLCLPEVPRKQLIFWARLLSSKQLPVHCWVRSWVS